MIVSEKTNGIYDVQMRGLNNIPDNNLILYTENANTLFMIDGRIAHNYAMGSPCFETMPISIEDIDRIEVVRGANSALYGPNAVNGVINIITAKPDNAQGHARGSLAMGNNTYTGEVSLSKKWSSKFASGITFNMQRRERPTTKNYAIPQSNIYLAANPDAWSTKGTTLSLQEFGAALATGQIVDIQNGAWVDIDDVRGHLSIGGKKTGDDGQTYLTIYPTHADYSEEGHFPDPELARKNVATNGYLTFTPANDVRVDVTGGYQYSTAANTPLGSEDFAFRKREYSTAYVNLQTDVKGLHILANYYGGVNDYCVGNHSFKMYQKLANASLEYDFKLGELGIRPGVSWQKVHFKDHGMYMVDYGNGPQEDSGFFGYWSKGDNSCHNEDVSASLRLDYQHEGLRLIGAARFDKTTFPDEWNPTWQAVASYKFNENNFLRLTYGRARRSATLCNTSSNYNWHRNGAPSFMQFLGNEETPLVKIDNFEIGYRWKPTDRILVDAEAFYSISDNYGELKAYESMLTLPGSTVSQLFSMETLSQILTGQMSTAQLGGGLASAIGTKAYIRYDEVPFEVKQKGISLNIDWIISSKLIAKLNANVQQTKIDNYYQYSQSAVILQQLTKAQMQTVGYTNPETGEAVEGNLSKLMKELLGSVGYTYQTAGAEAAQSYLQNSLGYTPVKQYRAKYEAMSDAEKEAFLSSLMAAANGGPAVDNIERPLGLYYALKYNIEYDNKSQTYYMGNREQVDFGSEDNYKHKASPAFYGNVGLIYRPIDKLSVSAYAYWMGEREFTTIFGTQKVDPYCTLNMKVGYKPASHCEIFLSGHNLLNSQKREFIYTDEIEGSYLVGVNFTF